MSRLRTFSLLVVAVSIATTAVYAGGRMPAKDKHYVSKDFRIFLPHPKDTQGWRTEKIADDNKNGMLTVVYKRPDSENRYDALLILIGYDHGGSLTYTDPDTAAETKISTGDVAKLAELEKSFMEKRFKVVKQRPKIKKVSISRDAGKGRHCSMTGTVEKEPLPSKHQVYVFKAYQKTYILRVLMPLNAANDKQTMSAVTKMIKGMRTYKP